MSAIREIYNSLSRKFDNETLSSTRMTVVFALLASLAPLGMDSYLPAVQAFAASLGVSAEQASWTLSNFLIGLGSGQLIGGALSDQKGRRSVVLWGLMVYVISCFVIVAHHNLLTALAFRFFQGFGAGLMAVCGTTMIKDTTSADKLAERLAMCVFIILLTPAVAPLIGATILLFAQWPMIFIFCGVIGLGMAVFVFLKIPETHHDKSGSASFQHALAQYWYVIRYRTEGKLIAVRMVVAGAMGSSFILVFVTTAPSNLMGHYGLTSSEFPFAFASVIVAMLTGNRCGKFLLSRFKHELIYAYGVRFQFLIAIAFLLVNVFFQVPIYVYIGMIMLGGGTHTAIGPAGQAMYLNLLDKNFGSASAIDQMMRFSSGGILGGIAVSLPLAPTVSVGLVLTLALSLSFLTFRSTEFYWNNKQSENGSH